MDDPNAETILCVGRKGVFAFLLYAGTALSVKYTDLVRVYEVDKSPKMSVARILGGLYYITEGVRWADWKFSIKLSEHVRA